MSDRKLFRAIRIKWSLALGAAILAALGSPIFAGTITVRSGADAGGTCPGASCTLRQALTTAAPGDTINFAAGLATITLTSGELLINKNLTISGPGASALNVSRGAGATSFRIFDVVSGVTATISGVTVSNGVMNATANNHEGGGIFNGGILTVANSTISGNSATGPTNAGGGISNTGTLTLSGSTISGNQSNNNGTGGGIHNTGTLIVTNSTISGNSADNSTPGGGGIKNEGPATITGSTISGNTMINSSGGKGAGIYNATGTITITSSTISGNNGDTGRGGGIENDATLTVVNCTVSNNSTLKGFGGGIYSSGGTVNAKNTIIALNSAANNLDVDFTGTLTSQGFNLIGNDNGASITPANQTGDQIGTSSAPIDPKLDTLKNNGGPTFTQALLSGSTAIEGGNSSGAGTDQRGFARPVDDPGINNASGGDGSDIGAYEVQADQLPGCSNINTVVNTNNDGVAGSLRDVIAHVCAGSIITFAPNVRGAIVLTSGAELVVNKSLTISGPGANLLSVQRNIAADTAPFYRIFNLSSASSNVSISGLTIAGGSNPGGSGGGIYSRGNLTLNNVTIAHNAASGGNGGGIYNAGTSFITNSTISGNTINSTIIAGSGGGLFNFGATLTITNSTFSGNSAVGPANQTPDHGGALYTNVGSVTITNSTITSNRSDNGGGVLAENGGVIKSRNTIIALNTSGSGPDVKGPITSQGFNLIGSSAGAMIAPAQFTDQIGITAAQLKLGPLQNNGGTTMTHALLSGSFAIDQGNSSGSSTDQRGFPRPVNQDNVANANGGDGADIGAFEFASAQLSNVSTRVRVLTGDKVLIGGFIVTGSAPKKVIIRAIGPSLTSFGVTGALADPILELHKPGNIVVSNDNWKTTQQAAIQATGIAPKNDLESAIVATLAPGNYTAIVRGKNNGIGVGLVEAYDLDQAAASQLGNISTRGFVDTGENVMIGGIIVGPAGAPSGKMLIRAIGPSLASSGIAGPLADPTLELHNGNGVLTASNDNWKSSQQAVIQATGIPPTNDLESAILATLAPGNYTAMVRGKNNVTGVALVEVYSLK